MSGADPIPLLQELASPGTRDRRTTPRSVLCRRTTPSIEKRFLLEHCDSGLFVHVEFVPDRLPNELRSVLRRFPENTLQLEVGVQTLEPSVAARINRIQNGGNGGQPYGCL